MIKVSVRELMWALRSFDVHTVTYSESCTQGESLVLAKYITVYFTFNEKYSMRVSDSMSKNEIIRSLQAQLGRFLAANKLCRYTGRLINDDYDAERMERKHVRKLMQRKDLTYEQKIILRRWYDEIGKTEEYV